MVAYIINDKVVSVSYTYESGIEVTDSVDEYTHRLRETVGHRV